MRDRFNERYIAAIKADCMHECCLESGFYLYRILF